MRRGASAMTVSGVTGQTASRPDSGSRMIDEAKVDAARLGTFSRSPRSSEPRHIRRGAKRLAILADPNAAGFYERHRAAGRQGRKSATMGGRAGNQRRMPRSVASRHQKGGR
jgi:hypothetical protein